MGKATVGVNWFDVSADLDDEAFLTYERISPYVAGFLRKQWFLRGEYVYGEKTIARRPGREADSHSVSIDSYYFIQGLKRYAVLGYTFRVDNARANRYDYDSHALKLRYVHRGTLANYRWSSNWKASSKTADTNPGSFYSDGAEDTRLRPSAELGLLITEYASVSVHVKNWIMINLPTANTAIWWWAPSCACLSSASPDAEPLPAMRAHGRKSGQPPLKLIVRNRRSDPGRERYINSAAAEHRASPPAQYSGEVNARRRR